MKKGVSATTCTFVCSLNEAGGGTTQLGSILHMSALHAIENRQA